MEIAFVIIAKFVIAILLAALAAYVGIYLFDRTTGGIDEWAELQKGNLAVGITLSAFIVGLAIILQNSLQVPNVPEDLAAGQYTLYVLLELFVRLVISFVMGIAGVLIGVFFYDRLTGNLDEFELIKAGNMAVAATMAGVIIATALLVAPVAGVASQFVSELLFG
ncbi:MAG: DUF350 domain-containing protein [Anaerolineae bacterium]|nr:DUF350 domain-containing protein [Anaerolineae bacterium]